MSKRTGRWILVIALFIFAVYAAYPPVRVSIEQERIVEKVAETAEEAQEHGVSLGDTYEISSETIFQRSLPFALGERGEDVRVVERKEDGSIVKEKTEFVEGRIKRGLDVAGGTELVYELIPPDEEVADVNVAQVIDIVRRRIDPQNIKEYIIQPAGENRILIQVPEATQAEVAALKDRITRMGRLEFRLGLPPTQEHASKYERAEEGVIEPGYEKMHIDGDPDNRFFLISDGEPAITGEYLQSVSVARDEMGQLAVGFRLTPAGGQRFARITSRNRGMVLGAVLDGILQSAPTIQSTIRERGQITGQFSQEEVDNLIAVLQAGSLPMDLDILQETTVGPQLGQDSIRQGLRAIFIAGVLVIVFMAGYYLLCGLVANAALMLNLVFLAGVLGLLGAALTLPGLAGILLTVGMAVDANVLIFERIREEVKAGKSIHVALRNGYDKAYSTIMDANITTLLTAIILYMVGTGPVRGFAITLSVGIVLSLFTSLYVTRLVFETLISREWMKSFKMAAFIGQPKFSYTKARGAGYICSLVVLALGLGIFALRGSDMLDVDFTGGTLVHLNFAENIPADTIRAKLIEGGYPSPQVQGVRGADREGSSEFRVRIPGVGDEKVKRQIMPGIVEKLEAEKLASEEDVTVGKDGRSINLMLNRQVDELRLRTILAGDDDNPYALEQIGEVLPAGDPHIDKFTLYVEDPGFRSVDEVLLDALWVLNRVGAQTLQVEIEVPDELSETEDGEPYITLKTDQTLDWRVLERGIKDLNLEELAVEREDEPAREFTLKGPEQQLQGISSGTVSFIDAQIVNDNTVTSELNNPISRTRMVLRLEERNLQNNIVMVSRGHETDSFVLALGEERVRENIEEIFAGLGVTGGISVSSEIQDSDIPGYSVATLEFDESVNEDIINFRLREAGIEPGRYLLTEIPAGASVSQIELRLPKDKVEAMMQAAVNSFADASPVSQTTSIGAVVAGEMQGRALLAIICAALIIVLYVGVRFHAVKFGIAAVIALLHDVAITAGIIAIADLTGVFGDVKINLPMLAAFLTIIGYSLNDTIVVFDRIRENTIQKGKSMLNDEIIDLSINQTFSRTVLTSFTTFTVVLVLYIFGGVALQGLAFTLLVGVLVGTYSSVFIASPILLDWQPIKLGTKLFFKVTTYPIRAPFILAGKLVG